jgi:hypothetical protein
VAARLRRELGIEVDMVHGRYGEYRIMVDGLPVIEGGLFSTMGILPSGDDVVEAVREQLASK